MRVQFRLVRIGVVLETFEFEQVLLRDNPDFQLPLNVTDGVHDVVPARDLLQAG